ncbi:MAG: PIG-L family deacetylase [Alistipes sp.]|nr:PIG-L family deacetylase [Alistipes sp.]
MKEKRKKDFSNKSIVLTAALAFVLLFTQNVRASVVSDEELNIRFTDGSPTDVLLDENYNTYMDVSEKTLVVDHADNVAGMYLIWDRPVGEYRITVWDLVDTCDWWGYQRIGATEILHQYVDLIYQGDEIEIDMPKDAVLCDIYFLDFGELPEWVQVWQEPYETADMLFIPTHADDELLFFGGAIPTYAGERGYKVQIAYMTNHWQERYRPHELLNGLWTCGETAYPVIGPFTDIYSESLEHAKTLYDEKEVVGYMVELIRRFKPYVILGHDINGEYGHGVHMYNTDALIKALELSGDSGQYPETAQRYGVWDVPKTYLHLYEENVIDLEWDTPLSRFDGKDGVEVASEAFDCHVSQRSFYVLERRKTSKFCCTLFGLYRSTVGLDEEKKDFLENVEFTKEKRQEYQRTVLSLLNRYNRIDNWIADFFDER